MFFVLICCCHTFCVGFLDKWFDEVESALIRKRRQQPKEGRNYAAFTLDNMQVAFYALAIGWTISIFVFLMEYFWVVQKKRPIIL